MSRLPWATAAHKQLAVILRVASFPTKFVRSPRAFHLLGRRAYTTMPSSHGFDAYCRKAEQGGTVERVCVALDVGLEMHDAFGASGPTADAARRRAAGPQTWIPEGGSRRRRSGASSCCATSGRWPAPAERDIMLATLNSVAQPRLVTPSRRTTASPTRPSTSLVYTTCWATPLGRRGRTRRRPRLVVFGGLGPYPWRPANSR